MKNKRESTSEYCPIAAASQVVGDFWNLLIIRELLKGCMRFNELQERIADITNSTLSDRLKFLAAEGIVERKQFDSIPPKVEYSLSEKGQALQPLVTEIQKFGNKWMPATS